ncbi:hypothetical protein [Ornithinimicrobium sediminis]|uniref:hypothetical protein n=1 Tax=Ornithinimicrobium sediminis TaxID=2904603 RepID=UPI001E5C5913|nr:hypothetical protein [Ornithinimicrobium sediminis]MCE0487436.1 hypothetical protein [Ornithinimicrobium sediminis]
MRRTAALVGAVALMAVGLAGPAQADGHPPGPPPQHGHMLVLGVVWDGDEPVGFRKCVDLAGGNKLGNNAHHQHAHTGKAGEALYRAGHLVVPTAPLTPFGGCADLEAMFGH